MIGNGVVVSPEALFRELDAMLERDVPMGRLVVSANAHVIASYHSTIDKVTERFLGKKQDRARPVAASARRTPTR